MGLITQEVEIGLAGVNIKHYESLGYNIPRRIDNQNRLAILKKAKIIVKTKDLLSNSIVKIETECDNCGKITSNSWVDYLKSRKENGETYCFKCGKILYGVENSRQARLLMGISFEQKCIEKNRLDILDLWDYELNILNNIKISPKDISHYSNYKYYFKCPKGIHESELKNIGSLTIDGYGRTNLNCKKCSSLLFIYPESKSFLSDENDVDIINYVSFGSNKELLWKCENNKHNEYLRSVKLSVKASFRCPSCVLERNESILQEKVRLYINELAEEFDFKINHENYCDLVCDSLKGWKLFYDNEIIHKYFNFVIEVHGQQHFLINGWHRVIAKKNNTTPQDELEYIQWKDQYKMDFALNNGYYYLAIPYTANDKDETWKYMINEMLNYIYENIQQEN